MLQSETHAVLCRRIGDITDRIKSALSVDDAKALMELVGEHRDVMDKLKQMGLSRDTRIYKQVEETRKQVYEVIAEIGKKRDELVQQIIGFEKKKKVSAAYARNKKSNVAFI
jgi:hypothetical protein